MLDGDNEPELWVDLYTKTDLLEGSVQELSHLHQSNALSDNQGWSVKKLKIPKLISFT